MSKEEQKEQKEKDQKDFVVTPWDESGNVDYKKLKTSDELLNAFDHIINKFFTQQLFKD